ncbi:hypothetical protein FAM09_24770 [Niastella caeni]|uniref:Uncharacterized protein n=1 Tax=Niastella caeni TaxID=2569763 RepID=A0A4S8HH22_9BACT|nr:hypothetical protein [Niastella caeni]THU34235.1 hypothetical protein FAM09_24770 [Niastella caeni]
MKTFLINLLKLIIAAIFVIGIDILIPFSSANGLEFVKRHGKLLLFVFAIINVYVGGAISGGFWSKNIKVGFTNWLKPPIIKGQLNPTYAFAALALLFNLLVVISWIEP